MPKWIERWEVPSSNGDKTYTVARDEEGNFGCDCPAYKFRRQVCRHIQEIRGKASVDIQADSNTPRVVAQRMWWWVYIPGLDISGPYETEADAFEAKRIGGGFVKGLPTSRFDVARRLLWVEIPGVPNKKGRKDKKAADVLVKNLQVRKKPEKTPRRRFDFD